MTKNKQIKSITVFENEPVRRTWDAEKEKWYFSVVDVVGILAQNDRPRKYWDDLKRKLKQEGGQLSEKIGQLKMQSKDGKFYETDVADTETLFRIIQSIPSPKAEPFKLWLAPPVSSIVPQGLWSWNAKGFHRASPLWSQ